MSTISHMPAVGSRRGGGAGRALRSDPSSPGNAGDGGGEGPRVNSKDGGGRQRGAVCAQCDRSPIGTEGYIVCGRMGGSGAGPPGGDGRREGKGSG